MMNFNEQLQWIKNHEKEWGVLSSGEYKHDGSLEYDYTHFESTFVANEIRKHYTPNGNVLDIGCYYHLVLGLCGSFQSVISIDIRSYGGPTPDNFHCLACDAKKLPFTDAHFSMIASQCTLEHIGLGMYGDAFDFSADKQAAKEMQRVLKPEGFLILTTTIANSNRPVVMHNAHRIYTTKMIYEYFEGLKLQHEAFYSVKEKKIITHDQVTSNRGEFDVYGCCWQKV